MLFALHKYAGLIAGVLLTIVGVTGSLLVFHDTLDRALTPSLRLPASAGPASLQQVVDNARQAVPGSDAQRLYLADPGDAHTVRFAGPEGAPGPVEVSVAPADARVVAVRQWGAYPTSWVYRLHYTLLAGTTGKYVVGVGGLCLLFFGFSGLYLWWPRRGRWRGSLRVRADKGAFRFHHDLHKSAGVLTLPVLMVVAFSGVALVFPGPLSAMVGGLLPLEPRPSHQAPPPSPDAARLTVDEAVRAGEHSFPDATLKRVYLPTTADAPYILAYNQPGEAWSRYPASRVWVDAYRGTVIDTWDPLTVAAGSRFLVWQFPLHNGDALGLAGRWLVVAAGLLPGLLFFTGLYLWWKKRRLKNRARQRRRPGRGGPSRSAPGPR